MIQRLYEILLRLYPARIRKEFGDEMRRVFLDAQHDARQRGTWSYANSVDARHSV